MKLLVTGGAGFIGSAFIRMSLGAEGGDSTLIVNLDKLTYAGNLANLEPVAANPRYRFVHGDICDGALVTALLALCRGPLPRHSGGPRKRPRRRDLQHRRQLLAAEHYGGAEDPGCYWDAGKPHKNCGGPPGARPPLCPFQREADARDGLVAV